MLLYLPKWTRERAIGRKKRCIHISYCLINLYFPFNWCRMREKLKQLPGESRMESVWLKKFLKWEIRLGSVFRIFFTLNLFYTFISLDLSAVRLPFGFTHKIHHPLVEWITSNKQPHKNRPRKNLNKHFLRLRRTTKSQQHKERKW